jgi:ATP-dependent DNA helicase RecQ
VSDLHAELRHAFRRGTPPGEPLPKPAGPPGAAHAVWRLLHAWRTSGAFGADEAVLLRQVARWGSAFVGSLPEAWAPFLARAGVRVTHAGVLEADSFRPAWLSADTPPGGIDSPPVERRRDDAVPAEAYLRQLDYGHWHSQAQKEAAWTVLDAPPGSTTLVALPTGSGKSLCFQLLPHFGSGLTVVVVPTVALALDQWRGAERLFRDVPGVNPRYFAADDPDTDPDTVAADVAAGRTRLVFTSPEACVSGRLRGALEAAASEGRLENLVVDEAHIIESWGAYFRVDFQVLALRQKQWLALSGGRMRTQLFSATFTPGCRDTLRRLFATGEWREMVSQRLRPEPGYWLHLFDDEKARLAAVLECAWRLPRPAVFYTTEVKHAEALETALRGEGFARVGCFTGDTPATRRRALLDAWRADGVDLMVATSAFGMGVDKADVRSVVHACLPEHLHRYYQEVGRSGRDGFSSTCLLLPSRGEERGARGMTARLIGEELAQERWDALWETRRPAPGDDGRTYRIWTGARRHGLRGTRTWGENVAWNKRFLLLLQRAGWIELVDAEWTVVDGTPQEWMTVRLAGINPHSRTLGAELAPHRDGELRAALDGVEQVVGYVNGGGPLCRTLARAYGEETERACGGCPGCRARGREPDECPPLPLAPPAEGRPARAVVDGWPHPLRQRTAFIQLARRVVQGGHARRFVCASGHHAAVCELLAQAVGADRPLPYRVDTLGSVPFTARPDETLAVLHVEELHPALLHERRGGRVVHLAAGAPLLDENGRYPFEADGARHFPTPDAWLEASTRVY